MQGCAGPDPHEGGAGHQGIKDLLWLSLYLFTQGGLDLTHMKVVLATKVSKISCDNLFITGTEWTGPDPHEGGAGHQDVYNHMWLFLYLLRQGGLDLTHRKVMLATKTLKITHVIIPLFTDAGVGWTWPTWRWFWPPRCLRSHVIISLFTDAGVGWTWRPHEGGAGHYDLMWLSLYWLPQGGLDLIHMKVVLATKMSKISCDYLVIDWRRVDWTWPTWRVCWPLRCLRSLVIIPLFVQGKPTFETIVNVYW